MRFETAREPHNECAIHSTNKKVRTKHRISTVWNTQLHETRKIRSCAYVTIINMIFLHLQNSDRLTFNCWGRTQFLPVIFRQASRNNYLLDPLPLFKGPARFWEISEILQRFTKLVHRNFSLKWVTKEICVKCFSINVLISLWVGVQREKANYPVYSDPFNYLFTQDAYVWGHLIPLVVNKKQNSACYSNKCLLRLIKRRKEDNRLSEQKRVSSKYEHISLCFYFK